MTARTVVVITCLNTGVTQTWKSGQVKNSNDFESYWRGNDFWLLKVRGRYTKYKVQNCPLINKFITTIIYKGFIYESVH